MSEASAAVSRPTVYAVPEAALNRVAGALGPGVRRGVPLSQFTSMRVGGPADLLVVVESAAELIRVVTLAREQGIPSRVLGGGCNVLVSDAGLRGLVIINRTCAVSVGEGLVRAESGALLAGVARACVQAGLAGMTWAVGLPGTVGGAVVGNAGAFGGDVAGSIASATLLTPDGDVVEREGEWFDFTYRGGRLKRASGRGFIVVSAAFNGRPGDRSALMARAEEVLVERRARHPAGPTMGSTFKNPVDGYAGHLIEEAGLKGRRVGDARVSPQHANFLVNEGDATAEDVVNLIARIQREVERQLGVRLALEIEMLGW